MEPSLSSIHSLVSEVKNDIFSNIDNVEAFVSPSAYDTAWLAMIPDHQDKGPMFGNCLNWILENQREGGFWGETNEEGFPTIDALPATLACILALNMWNAGHPNIESGLKFIDAKAEILLKINYQNLPRWFILTFPAMIELAEAAGLHLVFPPGLVAVIANIFIKRHHILQTEELVEEEESGVMHPPLLAYLETFPPTYDFDREKIVKQHLSGGGSLFESPSATAQAFLSTRNTDCLKYLRSLVSNFPNGVPAKYPIDGDLMKLCVVDHVRGLGLAEYFDQEIVEILAQIYRNQNKRKPKTNIIPTKLYKDALAFRLLRMYGHDVNPGSFCWFLHEPEIISYIEENHQHFTSAMYSVFRATDLQFPGEIELEEARSFAVKILEDSKARFKDLNFVISKGLHNMIKYELDVPWTARLDHLYHRKWIEENRTSPLWIGKASFFRLSCLDNKKLMQVAVENFEFLQSIYAQELEELKGWSKKWRLSEMGFGREKTVYTYFAVASCSFLPYNSVMRLVTAKGAIIVTVADDFYDMEGSLSELEILTDAVERWDGEGLKGHSKTIFDALDDFVNDIAAKGHFQQESKFVVQKLRDIWRETFMAWMVERRWSLSGHIPSMDDYLRTGIISIAAHTVALPATAFFSQNSVNDDPPQYPTITKLLMAIARLANDTHSYQKEAADGKMNLVLLHSMENPSATVEDSVAYVSQMLDAKTSEFLRHVFAGDEVAKPCRKVHLHCMKVFQMFFNSGNLFDSDTALADDIQRSIYLPIRRRTKPDPVAKPLPASITNSGKNMGRMCRISTEPFRPVLKHSGGTGSVERGTVKSGFVRNVHVPVRFGLSFIGLPM